MPQRLGLERAILRERHVSVLQSAVRQQHQRPAGAEVHVAVPGNMVAMLLPVAARFGNSERRKAASRANQQVRGVGNPPSLPAIERASQRKRRPRKRPRGEAAAAEEDQQLLPVQPQRRQHSRRSARQFAVQRGARLAVHSQFERLIRHTPQHSLARRSIDLNLLLE